MTLTQTLTMRDHDLDPMWNFCNRCGCSAMELADMPRSCYAPWDPRFWLWRAWYRLAKPFREWEAARLREIEVHRALVNRRAVQVRIRQDLDYLWIQGFDDPLHQIQWSELAPHR